MDTKRLIAFIVLSFSILLIWQEYFAPPPPPAKTQASLDTDAPKAQNSHQASPSDAAGALAKGERITVETDLVRAVIDTQGGDLRRLEFLKQGKIDDPTAPFPLFQDEGGKLYVAQTGLISTARNDLPTHRTRFQAEKTAYKLDSGGQKLEIPLTASTADGVEVRKTYIFSRNDYLIQVRYDIANQSGKALPFEAYYRFLRDGQAPDGESFMAYSFTGPAVYTDEGKFQKVEFSDLDKGKAEYTQQANNGWVAMLQHYFASAWIVSDLEGKSACGDAPCRYELKAANSGLYSAGTIISHAPLEAGQTRSFTMNLYAGPEETARLEKIAPGLDLTKDYGWTTIIAKPLFWLLDLLYRMVGNWGWAIVLLTILIKIVFYPLSAASYRSMAKMKAVAPRLQAMKERYGDDRLKMQQAMMDLYRTEKINPLGGCLPILIQIPVFIGLYWALWASVELRQAPWLGWITDLSQPDPFYILPLVMAVTMFAQTFLNPPPPDPLQAKMMKIMPLLFSVMFFFFPSGLVLYWVVNNILSMAQQWYINKQISDEAKRALNS